MREIIKAIVDWIVENMPMVILAFVIALVLFGLVVVGTSGCVTITQQTGDGQVEDNKHPTGPVITTPDLKCDPEKEECEEEAPGILPHP